MTRIRDDFESVAAAQRAVRDEEWALALRALVSDWVVAGESHREMADMIEKQTGRVDTAARGYGIMLEVAARQVRELVERMEEGR